jgi:outer membrane beta-barrel protein
MRCPSAWPWREASDPVRADGWLGRTLMGLCFAIVAFAAPAGVNAAEPDEPPAPSETDGQGEAGETGETGEGDAKEPAVVSDLDSLVRVVQQRPVLKSGRFELLGGAGIVANDQMYDHWFATVTGRVHVSEWISIGATYNKYFSEVSDLQRTVANDFEVFPELSAYRWYAGGDVTFVAIDGKFVFFDDVIAYWDIYASIGGGVTVTSRSDDPKPTGMIGVGWRLFLSDWLTFTTELRDYMFFEKFNAGNEFVNNVVGQIGLSIFIPFGFDYEYAK